jgi:hypothetical protein
LVELKTLARVSKATHRLVDGHEMPARVVASMRLARHFDDEVGRFEVYSTPVFPSGDESSPFVSPAGPTEAQKLGDGHEAPP